MDKEDAVYTHTHTHTHTHNGVLLSHKKDEIMPFVTTWMDLEIIILSKVSQKKKEKYNSTYMWNLKYGPNKLFYKTETDTENRGREGVGVWD